MSRCLVSLLIWMPGLFGASSLQAEHPLPDHYSDLKVYATSTRKGDEQRVQVQLEFVNKGQKALGVAADLPPAPALGLEQAVSQARVTIQPDSSHVWRFTLTPPRDVEREVVRGRILLGDVHARDLYLAFEGPDPQGFTSGDVETLSDPVTVVASYTPRTAEAIALVRERLYPPVERPVVLAADGRALMGVLFGQGVTDPAERAAAGLDVALDDLVRVVRQQSGAELRVLAHTDPQADDQQPAILLRQLARRPAAGTHDESFRLAIRSEGVTLESHTLEGLRHGLYTLLTDYMNAHWFMPGSLGEEMAVPGDRIVRLPVVDKVVNPSFFSAAGMSWGSERTWDRRNRSLINRGRMTYGHAWYGYINASNYPHETHAHLYARDAAGNIRKGGEGGRDTNFCTTNPEVLGIVAEAVNRHLSQPDTLVASLDPNDYSPMCLCASCVELDRKYGVENPDGTFVTDRLLHFSREIHDRLDEGNKDKYLGILIYAFQMELPLSARPHPRHTGMICNQAWTYDHTRPFNDPTSPRNRDFHRLVQRWGELLTTLGYYDYYGHWSYFGPWTLVHKLREDLRTFHAMGGNYLMIEAQPNFALHGLNHYVAAQLAWNIDRDVDVLVDDFHRLYYGPAEGPMRAYWEAMQRHQALTRSGPNVHRRVAARPGLWRELGGYLTEAQQAAGPADQRFRDRVQSARDGLKWGRLRWTVEGSTPIGLERPDSVDRLPPDRDMSFALAFLEAHASEFHELWAKYQEPGATDYWPRLTAAYFSVQVDAILDRLRTHEANRRAADMHVAE